MLMKQHVSKIDLSSWSVILTDNRIYQSALSLTLVLAADRYRKRLFSYSMRYRHYPTLWSVRHGHPRGALARWDDNLWTPL